MNNNTEDLIEERNRYRRLRENLNKHIEILNSSIDKLSLAINNINNNFTINDNFYITKQLDKNLESLKNDRNKITNTVMPAIERKIRKLGTEIELSKSLSDI